jgi:glycosyltransferase involved in cell wall biosynthesis
MSFVFLFSKQQNMKNEIYFDDLLLLVLLYLIYNTYTMVKNRINRRNKSDSKKKKEYVLNRNKKLKIGLFTNEIPPIVYGGVSTWILNFMEMFREDEDYDVIPIYLATNDPPHPSFFSKYKNIRIVKDKKDIENVFRDIDICINNIWVNLDIIRSIKQAYSDITLISVCHSLIKMEHITNLGSVYTNNFFEQEIVFQNSDYVVLISKAEKKYYNRFGYRKYGAVPVVIYNSYKPKFDHKTTYIDYENDNTGYIGRHVPRKRPEIPILSVVQSGKKDIKVYNMGVDYKYDNNYWKLLSKKYSEQLNIIPFTTDSKKKEEFYRNVGSVCITGIYEPFGYTICEAIDRRIPCISMNLDGPSEIMGKYKDCLYTYDVDKKSLNRDVQSFSSALEKFWNTSPQKRRDMSEKARQALDRFRPEVIRIDWKKLLDKL